MNRFVKATLKALGVTPTAALNCCKGEGIIIDDETINFNITLPDGTLIEVHASSDEDTDDGFAYVPEYDAESPSMCADELGAWVSDCLDCGRRIDAYYASLANCATTLNSKLDADISVRIKNVFRAAQSAVDLPDGFRYGAYRTQGDLILSTLFYKSATAGEQWIAKSSLALDASEGENGVDDWVFEPNYSPDSEADIKKHRKGHFVDVELGAYGETVTGDTPEDRDKKAAYWLVGLLSDMVDSMLDNPPARCYPLFLADGIAGVKKSSLDKMSNPGIKNLVRKGLVKAEDVLRAKPTLAQDLVKSGLITPEIVARRTPDRIFWLVQQGYISPDYAVKVDPTIKDKLIKRGLYSVSEGLPDDPAELLKAVQAGTVKPVDAYRKNAKILQPLVEQKLITPQEAYKLDASIITWLLINHYIGREEAQKIKPDIKKYLARKYKDVVWDDLDASIKPGLNSSLSFNSNVVIGSESVSDADTNHIPEEGDFDAYGYGPGYEDLRDTQAQGPAYVAEVMLPEDDFDGIVVPGESEELAKETLTQMLLANDGTFIDWTPIPCIQTFKSENPDKHFLVLN